jgi:hypothetical protein
MVDLDEHAKALADGITDDLPRWVERSVDRIHRAWAGPPPPAVAEAARRAGAAAAAELVPSIRRLLETDIDEQATNPLALLRGAVRYPTGVLQGAGVPPVQRDPADEAMFPDDAYGLTPASFADIDPTLAEPGLAWGAAKAWVHRQRHGGPREP